MSVMKDGLRYVDIIIAGALLVRFRIAHSVPYVFLRGFYFSDSVSLKKRAKEGSSSNLVRIGPELRVPLKALQDYWN